MTPDELLRAQQALGITFRQPALLGEALTHASYSNENPSRAPVPNERLEFLGDAVLDLVVAERLFRAFPEMNEGELTRRRALLVRRETLARVARKVGLGDHLCLGKGEETSGGRSKPANLSGAMEAVIGAVYLDQGLAAAAAFISRLFQEEFTRSLGREIEHNYKSELQELTQAHRQQTPSYHLVEASGPDHNRTFTVEVRLGDTVLGRGTGKSKKAAETAAAQAVLERLRAGFTL